LKLFGHVRDLLLGGSVKGNRMTIFEWLLNSPNPQIESEYSDPSRNDGDVTFENDQQDSAAQVSHADDEDSYLL
jgi:hypothetical protein